MSWKEYLSSTWFGRFLRGIMKILLAGFLISAVQGLSNVNMNVTLGDQTYDLGVIIQIIIAFFPVLLIISAMRDLDIKL